MQEASQAVLAGMLAFAITLAVGPGAIRYLYRLKFGQQIREAGPASHQKKSGTPTMGGVIIIVALTISTLLATGKTTLVPYALFVTVGYGLIGLVDDFISVVAKRSLGLKARQKLLGQTLIALLLAFYALNDPRLGSAILVPFTGATWYLPPWLFVVLATGTVVGFANAVNLTDGLDGLAAGSTAVSTVIYAVIAFLIGSTELSIFSAAVAGACLGFSWFNSHPAQVFMGDTGALALGGALGALAVLTRTELLLVIVGGLFVLETLSDIIQVLYFRATGGKRIFRMAPLHHHFEMIGWSETKVVARFWLLAMVFGLVGLLSFL